MITKDLYTPPDVADAHELWGANCGPAALAAILGQPVMTMRPFLADFATRPFMTPTQLSAALRAAQQPFRVRRHLSEARPQYGLLFVQWEGPWTQPGVPVRAAYTHTHWVGVAWTADQGQMLYDVNAGDDARWGGWCAARTWALHIVPAICEGIPGADGGWFVRWACDVTRRERHEELWRS